jgi:UDPglucose 6-dehydrogenase
MKIGFLGLGKLGLSCALAIESKGHDVVGYDSNPIVQEYIRNKKIPYKEEGVNQALINSNIKLVTLSELVKFSEIIFVGIQTPHHEKYEGVTELPQDRVDFDYTFLKNASLELSEEIKKQNLEKTVIIISTVLPGTIAREIKPLLNNQVKLCYNPFFIAMGTTMHDYLNPEFVLFGVEDLDAAKKAEEFYKTITSVPFFKTSIQNAELIKVAYNTFIGMKIVFANVLMEICHKTGANVDEVTDALKLANDRLISGKYFTGGMGDGGACHPRDNIALSWLSRKLNLSFDWFENIMLAREKQTEWLANLMEEYDLPKVILGTSYKPESNLEIGSASLLLKNILEKRGHKVTKYDPYVDSDTADNIKNKFKEPCIFLIGTKHHDFINFDFPEGSVIIDPWRYMPDRNGIKTIRLGENNYS